MMMPKDKYPQQHNYLMILFSLEKTTETGTINPTSLRYSHGWCAITRRLKGGLHKPLVNEDEREGDRTHQGRIYSPEIRIIKSWSLLYKPVDITGNIQQKERVKSLKFFYQKTEYLQLRPFRYPHGWCAITRRLNCTNRS
ncbi:hypothetical protein EDC94DRAFT_590234 [Helicostylum pulchrum]|nr:hypothetical protein EDC94DRAFT_590234 [Helicostylum pulchrum]